MKLRSGRKSGHAKIPPICSPIKYLESSFPYRVPVDSSNRARIDGSWKSREYFDDGESREPSPFAFRRQKSNADMQNYRAQKQMKVAIKIKDANFVAPASTCNTILSTSVSFDIVNFILIKLFKKIEAKSEICLIQDFMLSVVYSPDTFLK